MITLDFVVGCLFGGLAGFLLCAMFVIAQDKRYYEELYK